MQVRAYTPQNPQVGKKTGGALTPPAFYCIAVGVG